MAESFPNIDDLIEHILPCIESHADGRNQTTRERRRAMVWFFDRHTALCCSEMPKIDIMIDDITSLTVLFAAALDTVQQSERQNGTTLDKISNTLLAVLETLSAAVTRLLENERGPWTVEDSARCHHALHSIFDWSETDNLRAYVYAITNEVLEDGLLGKERTLLIQAVQKCAEERLT